MDDKMTPAGAAMMQSLVNMVGYDCPKEENGDYRNEEGLLVCGVCGKRKERRLNVPYLGERVVPTLCACGEEKIRREEEEKVRREEQKRCDDLFSFSLIDDRFKESTFENFKINEYNQRQFKLAKRYVEKFEEMYARNKGLLFYGEPSTGKTYLASCIANALLKKRVPLIVTSIIKLTSASGPFSKEAEEQRLLVRKMNAARLLVIDDLGTERETDYKMEQVFEIIDSRYGAKRPMIITTNLSLYQMQHEPNMRKRRVYERIFEICHPVEFTGPSWRWNTAEKDYDEINNILLGD